MSKHGYKSKPAIDQKIVSLYYIKNKMLCHTIATNASNEAGCPESDSNHLDAQRGISTPR